MKIDFKLSFRNSAPLGKELFWSLGIDFVSKLNYYNKQLN